MAIPLWKSILRPFGSESMRALHLSVCQHHNMLSILLYKLLLCPTYTMYTLSSRDQFLLVLVW